MKLDEFADANAPKDGTGRFQLESDKLLDVALDGSAMLKAGSMVGHTGDVSFTGKSSAEGGLTGFLKQKVTSEGTPIMEASGAGHVYVADQGKKIQILELAAGESLSVNGNDILAFESSVDYSIGTVGSFSATKAGGLVNVYLEGPGNVAITTHGDPLVLTPPVKTDPDATVAWSGSLSPGRSSNLNLGDMVGQSSGERYQLDFSGSDGFVIVQPYEEVQPEQ
ncbi:AIM24 family protein [Salinilacihabitans rarus]|uniref:AIM24 family protein n=1 Tax=Salinilacihabitans rarus TaxID=2961596 RepID=UPI0020C921C3|nr:AIM24 family protein [Salinilacihabitans rarus]